MTFHRPIENTQPLHLLTQKANRPITWQHFCMFRHLQGRHNLLKIKLTIMMREKEDWKSYCRSTGIFTHNHKVCREWPKIRENMQWATAVWMKWSFSCQWSEEMGRLVGDDKKTTATETQKPTGYRQNKENSSSECTVCWTLKQMGFSSRGPHLVLSAENRKLGVTFTGSPKFEN